MHSFTSQNYLDSRVLKNSPLKLVLSENESIFIEDIGGSFLLLFSSAEGGVGGGGGYNNYKKKNLWNKTFPYKVTSLIRMSASNFMSQTQTGILTSLNLCFCYQVKLR